MNKLFSNRQPGRAAVMTACAVLIVLAALAAPRGSAQAPPKPVIPDPARWADWVEPNFPFFSSVLDAGKSGVGPANNLTPRGLILNLGRGYWAAFDTDLLRIAAIWRGNGVTPKALAPGSYRAPDKKTPGGQYPAPEPDGTVWLANGIYAGWQSGARPLLEDVRQPAPSVEEVGRGPLPDQMGKFKAVHLVGSGAGSGVVLEYTAGSAAVREWMTPFEDTASKTVAVVRHFEVAPAKTHLWLMAGMTAKNASVALVPRPGVSSVVELTSITTADKADALSRVWTARVPPHEQPIQFSIVVSPSANAPAVAPHAMASGPSPRRWPQDVTTTITRSASKDPYVVDDVALPLENPWRRNVRIGDIQFLQDGTGVGVTLDGDVWIIRGLHEPKGVARWTRFASGLHEPLTLAIRDEQVYVFDRNGIWRLRDTNGDGEADVHELFSNAFAQTADMREFPSGIRLGPGGEFVIAKGGQEATTIGKHNGSVLRISADGKQATVLGYGFRQPNISVNPRNGLVIASDQQGHYIPTTPLHVVGDNQFYGFLSDKLPREVYPAPIAEPLTWIPHATNASAMSQVWLMNARMGPLNDSLVHISFNAPELFRVLMNDRGKRPQAGVVTITRAFDFPPLHGSVNPADGQLYLAGFQILGWGTTATKLAGLGRVRYTGAPLTVPRDAVAMDKGVLLRFDVAVDRAKAENPDNYSLTSWQYKRTFNYGSPQFKADGSPGIDRLSPSRAYVSKDGRSVFLAVPGMKPVMQMRLGWSLSTAEGMAFQNSVYFTPYELVPFAPERDGFGSLTVDLTPRPVAASASAPVSVDEGRRLSQLFGCIACHAIDDSTVSRLGPTWKGLYGSQRPYAKGVLKAFADEAYLRESMLDPAAKIVMGYERGEAGMPSYSGVLSPNQIESIIEFIKTLK
jgi:mono/diheme cytochrome c family protein